MDNKNENNMHDPGGWNDPPDRHSMQVPEGYFEDLERNILQKTIYSGTAVPEAKIIRIKWTRILLAVAAISAVAYFGLHFLLTNDQRPLEIRLAEMSGAEIDNFMEEQLAGLSYDDLHNYIADNITQIQTEMLFTTDFIDDASALDKITEDVHDQILHPEVEQETINGSLLDEELLKQIDDQELQDYLNDATLFDDFAL